MAAGMADHKMDTSFLEEVKKEAADAFNMKFAEEKECLAEQIMQRVIQ